MIAQKKRGQYANFKKKYELLIKKVSRKKYYREYVVY